MLPYSVGNQLETVNGCGHGLGTVSWVEIIIVVLYLIPSFYHCAAFVQEIRLAVNGKPAALDHGSFRTAIIGVQVIPDIAALDPALLHVSAFAQVIPLSAGLLPACEHPACAVKEIPFIIPLKPAVLPTGKTAAKK